MTASELRYLIAAKNKSMGEKGASSTAIAEELNVSKASVTRAANRLISRGLAERRGTKIVVTEYGLSQLAEYMLMITFGKSHLVMHCGISEQVATDDAIAAVCALSDETRSALAKLIKGGMLYDGI